jgi:hypothetical protein
MATAKTATAPATASSPEGAPSDSGAPSDEHLRSVIREELAKVISGGEVDPSEGVITEPDEGDDEVNLSLREITNRALKMTTKALDKIPGAKGADAAPAEPAEPGPETVPAQISRGMRWLGFGDPE